MNVRGVKPRPDPRQLEFNFPPRAVSLKDYADLLTKAIIYGHAFVDFRGRTPGPNPQQVSRIHGTRADTIILDEI
ncbi:hypothetical protein JQ506_07750 [Shinella sp. PSBB067]|uniref:hypothetical protein n=1 Tax=Shinella sp. PSBB067 TaxID=2715959 RepID=UPI00193BC4D2|nr:hypothetical protein [Shinella sp. PSBB067]QRI64874.1 hypothetical protein JQ506_07750 [Shinella sp. PSBB067]